MEVDHDSIEVITFNRSTRRLPIPQTYMFYPLSGVKSTLVIQRWRKPAKDEGLRVIAIGINNMIVVNFLIVGVGDSETMHLQHCLQNRTSEEEQSDPEPFQNVRLTCLQKL